MKRKYLKSLLLLGSVLIILSIIMSMSYSIYAGVLDSKITLSQQNTYDENRIAPDGVLPTTINGAEYINRAGIATAAFANTTSIDLTSFGQGPIGDCGPIAAIIAVAASRPEIMFQKLRYIGRDSGDVDTYEIDLYVNDGWKTFVVNANTPKNGSHQTYPGNNNLWGPLYEKALAAAKNGYDNILGLNTTEVIEIISGIKVTQNPSAGDDAILAISEKSPVTSVGLSGGVGYYDPETGDRVYDNLPSNAVYMRDQHYYVAAEISGDSIVMINPWNHGAPNKNDDKGRFILSKKAYARIFWAYTFAR